MMAKLAQHLLRAMEDLGEKDLKKFQWFLHQGDVVQGLRAIPKSWLEDADRQDTVDHMVQAYGHDGALAVTAELLAKINRNDLVQWFSNTNMGMEERAGKVGDNLDKIKAFSFHPQFSPLQQHPTLSIQSEALSEHSSLIKSYQRTLQSNLQNRFMYVVEGLSKQKDKKHLDDIYTELYMTEGNDIEINCQHEVRQIEIASRKLQRMEKPIKPCNIFNHPSRKYIPIKTVLSNGIAGVGKTFLVYKFILDWAVGASNQDVHLTFPFTFRQLNLLKGKQFSLVELIHTCIRETLAIDEGGLNHIFASLQTSGNSNYDKSNYKILFVLDGLDENRLQLDLTAEQRHSVDIMESNSVDVLMSNLITGKLLPSARLWITTRPEAAGQIPPEYVDMVTELRGFTDPQKEEYFRKRFKDKELACGIISHLKNSRSLHIMCHIPVFCWITATVLEHVLSTGQREQMPENLTELYTHFLVFQIKQTTLRWGAEKSLQSIESLAKLAFDHLEKGNLIFYERDLKKSGIPYNEACLYSGVFTQIFKEEHGLYQDKVFSFVHLTIQEYLAAVHVAISLINNNTNVIKQQGIFQSLLALFRKVPAAEVHIMAVDRALQSANGHLDMFLRFLLGLSLETNQILLQGLLKRPGRSPETNQVIVDYIKKQIKENPRPEKCINLFHCLNELNDRSLVEGIQLYLKTGRLSTMKLSSAEWSALAFVLLTSGESLAVFDLRKYCRSDDGLLRMLSLVKASITAILTQCELSYQCCEALSSVLNSATLRDLDLTKNPLEDSGVKLLSAGLRSPQCRLQTLRLSDCLLTEESCLSLSWALRSNPAHLRELDLSRNNIRDLGLKRLLSTPGSLKTLRLKFCGLTRECCGSVASVLSSSSLTELDLSDNDLWNEGVKRLSTGLGNPHCRLETLRLSGCLITEAGCAALAAALSANRGHLRELDLSYNKPGDSGVRKLSAGMADPNWSLEIKSVNHSGRRRLRHMKLYFLRSPI